MTPIVAASLELNADLGFQALGASEYRRESPIRRQAGVESLSQIKCNRCIDAHL